MSEEKKEKAGSFDPWCVADIYDKLSGHNYALRAFAALLRSSDLADFADQNLSDTLKSDNFETSNLRWGLSQIIDLYLAHQESILSGYMDQYHKSDYELVRRSKYLIGMADQGAYVSDRYLWFPAVSGKPPYVPFSCHKAVFFFCLWVCDTAVSCRKGWSD